jgi:hypothetical protein
MNLHREHAQLITRRHFFRRCNSGIGAIALASLMGENRFAGAPVTEELTLVDPYKGIRRDAGGKQVGRSELFTRWRVRKHLLDDLYIRFFRLAEERIGHVAEYGVVSFISNSSYLAGRSHPIMRESLCRSFHEIWINNLNGDKYKTGKVDYLDGITVQYPSWWFNVRPSNTEPLLRLVVEAKTPEELEIREAELVGMLGHPVD